MTRALNQRSRSVRRMSDGNAKVKRRKQVLSRGRSKSTGDVPGTPAPISSQPPGQSPAEVFASGPHYGPTTPQTQQLPPSPPSGPSTDNPLPARSPVTTQPTTPSKS